MELFSRALYWFFIRLHCRVRDTTLHYMENIQKSARTEGLKRVPSRLVCSVAKPATPSGASGCTVAA